MANTIVEKWAIDLDTSAVEAGSKRAESSITGAFAKGAIAANVALKAVGLLTDAIMAGVDAAVENEKTNIRLAAALKASGQEVENNAAKLNAQSDALEKLTGTSDEVIRSLQASAINYGSSADAADKYVRAALALSKATGVDAKGALESLIKAQATGEARLLKMIPGVADMTSEQIKQGDALDRVTMLYGDFLDLDNRGLTGTFNRMNTAIGNIAESLVLGAANTGVFKSAMDGLAATLEGIADTVAQTSFTEFLDAIFLGGGDATVFQRMEREQYERANKRRENRFNTDFSDQTGATIDLTIAGPGKKKPGKEDGGIEFDFDGMRQKYDDQLSIIMDAEAEKAEILNRYFEDRLSYQVDLQERHNAYMDKLRQEEIEKNAQAQQMISSVTSIAFGQLSDAMVTVFEGGSLKADEFFSGLLKSVGRYMVARGMAYLAEAAAMAFVPGLQGNASGLVAAGGGMIALGGALIAGGAQVGGGEGASAGSSGGGSGGGGSGFVGRPGGSFTRSRDSGDDSGPSTIIVNVTGAVTEAGVGVMVDRALRKARQQRVI